MPTKPTLLLFLSLLLGSFSDEAAQIIFALQLGSAEQVYLTSSLLLLGMTGGLFANVFYSRLAAHFSTKQLILLALFGQAILIVATSLANHPIAYLFTAFLLGVLGGLLWSAVLILIPAISPNPEALESTNKYAHSIRNMGFMAGPILGGSFSYLLQTNFALLFIGGLTLLSGIAIYFAMQGIQNFANDKSQAAINGLSAIAKLLRNRTIFRAIAPLVITIICTSALSVLLIVYLTDIIKLNGVQYGIFSSAVSLSLAFAPLVLVKPFTKLGEPVAASLSAMMIGISLLLVGLSENIYLIVLFGAMMGAFNGCQNTLMSAFMLKNIAEQERNNQMPAYVLILQLSVIAGYLFSMLVKSSQFTSIFWGLSSLTVLAGMSGVWLNRAERKQL